MNLPDTYQIRFLVMMPRTSGVMMHMTAELPYVPRKDDCLRLCAEEICRHVDMIYWNVAGGFTVYLRPAVLDSIEAMKAAGWKSNLP